MFNLSLEYELAPDVLAAAEDVLRVLTPKAEKQVEIPHEVTCNPHDSTGSVAEIIHLV